MKLIALTDDASLRIDAYRSTGRHHVWLNRGMLKSRLGHVERGVGRGQWRLFNSVNAHVATTGTLREAAVMLLLFAGHRKLHELYMRARR